MLLVFMGNLVSVAAEESYTILTDVSGPVNYAVLNDEIYWSDGTKVGQVKADGTPGVWGLANPPTPQVQALATGGLFAGTYQVAMTAVHSSGLESGCTETVSVEVPDGGGIQVTTPTANGVRFALYRTPANGGQEELRQALVALPGTIPALGVQALGKSLESLHAVRPLPGQCLAHFKGRLWCASGNVVWFTSERSPHWLFPNQGFYQFESPVTVLSPTEDGLYVGLRDQIYYLQGDNPLEMKQRPVANVGAVYPSGAEIPYNLFLGEGAFPSRQCAFYDTDGFLCIGKPGGIIVRPTQPRFSAGQAVSGALTYREHEGLRQLVSVVAGDASPLQASTIAVSEVFANGVALNTGQD